MCHSGWTGGGLFVTCAEMRGGTAQAGGKGPADGEVTGILSGVMVTHNDNGMCSLAVV